MTSIDPFKEIRALVSCRDVGERYGLAVRRDGFTNCLWHSDRNPSLKLYGPGQGCYCFSCGKSTDVIGLAAKILDVDRVAATKELDREFSLALPFEGIITDEQRRMTKEREESRERREAFVDWQEDLDKRLNRCHYIGWEALRQGKQPEDMTDGEALAVKYLPVLEDYAKTLETTDLKKILFIFANREGVSRICDLILKSTYRQSETCRN